MDGLGSPTSLGAGRLITMAVGFIMAIPGPGGPDRLAGVIIPCGLPLMFRFLDLADAAVDLEQGLDSARSAGARLAHLTPTVHGTDAGSTTRSAR